MRERGAAVRRRSVWLDAWYAPVTIVLLAALAAIAVARMTTSTADFDPQFMRVVVERTIRFGGGYYENAVHNKGPLEPVVYETAARFGGRAGFWFVIAVFTFAAAACVGAASALIAGRAGAGWPVAAAVEAGVVVHLTLSESDYAGVLYTRNMVVALLCVAVAVTLVERCWATERRRRLAVVVIGVATGLSVQTLMTACFTAAPVLLFAMWVRGDARVLRGRVAWWLPVVAAATFGSALAWYAVADLFGFRSFDAFIDGWWRYARYMSEATGRGPGGQLALWWDRVTVYYVERPVVGLGLALWAVVAALRFRRASPQERALVVLLAAWFAGAWIELAVSQRYSSHYFSVVAVPSLLMAAQLTGWATARWRERVEAAPAMRALPLAAALVAVPIGGTAPFGEGIETVSTVHSFGALDRRADAGRAGRIHFERAALSVFSEPGDPLLAWTSYPWLYLDRQRVAATRYIWKEFLLGEIYLGGRSDEFVLPGTWEHWERDLVASNPVGSIVESANPVEPGTPFDRVVGARFTTVHTNPEATLALRDDLAAWLRERPADGAPGAGRRLAEHGCVRVDGTLEEGETRFAIGDASIRVHLDAHGGGLAESNRHGVSSFQVTVAPGSTDFTLVAGARATLLAIGGDVVAAVERGGVPIEADGALSRYTTSQVHPLSGC